MSALTPECADARVRRRPSAQTPECTRARCMPVPHISPTNLHARLHRGCLHKKATHMPLCVGQSAQVRPKWAHRAIFGVQVWRVCCSAEQARSFGNECTCRVRRLRTRASAHSGVCALRRLRTRASAHSSHFPENELALQSSTRATLAPRISLDVPTSGAPEHSTPRKLACALPFYVTSPAGYLHTRLMRIV